MRASPAGWTNGIRTPTGRRGVALGAGLFALLATAAGAQGVPAARAMPRPEVLELALRAHDCAVRSGELSSPILAVIDFARPSTERRLWVLDVEQGTTLHHERVAHGRGSGELHATRFSNEHGTKQSSLGLFRAGEVYHGQWGRSLRLDGLEPGVNDRARERAIVMHGADYATEAFAKRHGRLGRSWGCPAVDPAVADAVIDALREGAGLFAYHPAPGWLATSPFLHCGADDHGSPPGAGAPGGPRAGDR